MRNFISHKAHTGLLFLLFGFLGQSGWGQTYYDMSSGNYFQDFADISNWTNNYAAGSGAGNWKKASVAVNSAVTAGTVFVTTGATGAGVQRGTGALIIGAAFANSCATDLLINFSGRFAGNLSLDWAKVTNVVSATPLSADLKVQYSTDGGSSFADITGFTLPRILNSNTAESGSLSSITLPAALNNKSTVVLRFFVWNNGQTVGSGNRPKFKLDNISITSTAIPSLTISGAATASAFTTTYGTASAAQSFAVSGSSLSADITATAPTGFEVSSDGTNYSNTATFSQSSGTASGTLSIRLKATATVTGTNYNSVTIQLTSENATTVNITTASSGNSVTTKALTISGISISNKVYDANTTATILGTAIYSGLVSGDNSIVADSPTAVFADKTVANAKAVTVSGYTAPSANYSITQPTGLTANITAATITLTSASVTSRTYNGTTAAIITGTLSGVIQDDVVTLNGTGTFASANAGTGISVTSTSTLGGADAGNYALTQPTGLTGDIIKANQTITFNALVNQTTGVADYSPDANSATSGTNTIMYTSSDTAVASITAGGLIHIVGAGTTTITASQAASTNYNAADDVSQTLSVTFNTDFFRSFASGNWNTVGTWQSASTTSGPWTTATTTPGANNSVFIQSGHTVTLTQNESVNDLHIASGTSSTIASSAKGTVALSTFTLSVNGKLRDYYATVGTVPGTNQSYGYPSYPFTATTGKVSVVGNSRTVFTSGEWCETVTNTTSANFQLEINMNAGQTATATANIICSNLNVVAGIFDVVTIGLDNGTVGQGDATIASGATIKSSATSGSNVFQKTGSALAGTLTVNGALVLTGISPLISMTTIAFNGTVEYSASGNQTLAILVNGGASPNAYTNLIINGSGVKNLGIDTTVNGTLTQTSGKLEVGSNTLKLNGAYIGDATNSITGGPSSNLTTTGSTGTLYFDQTTPGTTNVLKNFTISSGSATIGNALNITAGSTPGVLSVGASATLTTGDNLTLKSDANGTARVSEVGAGGAITGNVTVERYIPAKRAWRALTAPLKGSDTSLYSSWQNNGTTIANTGVALWGPSGTGLATGPAYNIRRYTTSGWADVSNTQLTNLFTSSANNAFMVFVTGEYGSPNIGNGQSSATTLKATGELITGTVNYSLSSTNHTLIGNPFASPISPAAILSNTANTNTALLFPYLWVWNPAYNTNGAYELYDKVAGTYSGGNLSAGTAIQSGQAFFVRTETASSSLILTESMKSSSISNTFRNSNSITPSIVRASFLKQTALDWMPLDGCIAAFYEGANAAADEADGKKMINSGENIGFVRNAVNLSSEHYPLVTNQDILNLKIWNTQQAHYKLKFNTEEFTMVGVEAYLQDLYTGTTQPLNLDGSAQDYEFDVDPTVSASSGNRFRIVFTNMALAVANPEQGQLSIYPNPATGGKVTVSLPTGTFEGCSYELINVLGQVVRQDEITNSNSSQVLIPLTGLPNSWYALRIRKENKVVCQGKLIINN